MGAWRDELERLLTTNATKPSRERLTLIRIFEDLRDIGYEGSYSSIWRHARAWEKARGSAAADAYVPLIFAPGEDYQFDWSHEIVILNGVTTTVSSGGTSLTMTLTARKAIATSWPAAFRNDMESPRKRPSVRWMTGPDAPNDDLEAALLRAASFASNPAKTTGVPGSPGLKDRYFKSAVIIEPRFGKIREAATVAQAALFLVREWPERSGKKYRAALEACLHVLKGEKPPYIARRAFIVAAREARILDEEDAAASLQTGHEKPMPP